MDEGYFPFRVVHPFFPFLSFFRPIPPPFPPSFELEVFSFANPALSLLFSLRPKNQVIETIDRLRHKLKDERSGLLSAQKKEQEELSEVSHHKQKLCKSADDVDALLMKATADRNVYVDRLTKVRRELMISVTVKTKNSK